MPAKPLETSVRVYPGAAVVDLSGEIDTFSKEPLNLAYAEAIQTDPAAVVLNFNQVDYINSTGIALIVSLLSKARSAKMRLSVFGLSPHYVEIFNITRLSDFIDIYEDEDSALTGESQAIG